MNKMAAICFIILVIWTHPVVGQIETSRTAAEQKNSGSSSPIIEIREDLPLFALNRLGNRGEQSQDNGYYRLVFSPDGKLLAARNRRNTLEIYDARSGDLRCQIEGHDALINTIDFSADSELVLTTGSGNDEKIRIWSTRNGRLQAEIKVESPVAFFELNPTHVLALGDNSVDTFELSTGKRIRSVKWKDQRRPLTMSRDGTQVLFSRVLQAKLRQLQILDLRSKSKTILDGPTVLTKAVSIAPNGLWIAASYANRDPKIRLWDLRNPHEDKFILDGHKNAVQSLTFSDDGRFLISTSWDRSVIVWDVLTRKNVAQFSGHTENVNASAYSSIDLVIASGASGRTDSSILLWDLKTALFKKREIPKAFDSFDVVWKELGSSFPEQAFLAVEAILNHEGDWLKRLSTKIGITSKTVSLDDVAAWIQRLDSPEYKVREAATNQLSLSRGVAEPLLREALANPPSTEVEYRILSILRRQARRPNIEASELRRIHRSIFALELLGSPEAKTILHNISGGHADIDVALDATASLQRISIRESQNQPGG